MFVRNQGEEKAESKSLILVKSRLMYKVKSVVVSSSTNRHLQMANSVPVDDLKLPTEEENKVHFCVEEIANKLNYVET